jgi:uncharacterized protein (TIGR04255 family)
MTEPTHLPKAPITEALLDIRVKLPPHTDLVRLATLQELLKDRYPSRRERVLWQSDFHITPGTIEMAAPTGETTGYLFTSLDGKQIVQARLDGFTLNRLAPYKDWASLRDEARDLWRHYVRIASPSSITRAALRYINRLELPLPLRDFKEYILTTPEVAPGLPQGLATFFMRLVIPVPTRQAVAIVTQTCESLADMGSVLPLIFDIDVFREAAFDVEADEVWDTFETLHELKNEIFFKSITDKTKELCQ